MCLHQLTRAGQIKSSRLHFDLTLSKYIGNRLCKFVFQIVNKTIKISSIFILCYNNLLENKIVLPILYFLNFIWHYSQNQFYMKFWTIDIILNFRECFRLCFLSTVQFVSVCVRRVFLRQVFRKNNIFWLNLSSP